MTARTRAKQDARVPAAPGRLSRRAFLKTAAAVTTVASARTAFAGVPAVIASASVDVIVVGAGFAGLTTALELRKRGASALVLEARNRVGGRTLNASLGADRVVEVGGQFVGPTQTAVLDLAREVGVGTFPTYNTGNNLLLYQGEVLPYDSAGLPPVPQSDLDELLRELVGGLDVLSQKIPLDTPWQASEVDVRALDGETLETWRREHLTTHGANVLLDVITRTVFGCEPRDISLLYFLFYLHSGGGILQLTTTGGGAQDARFRGGSQQVAKEIAARLGGRVRLGVAVRRIRDLGRQVVVETDRGRYQAGRVVVALAPTLAGRIEFDPVLPAHRDQLTQRVPQGSLLKVEAVYAAPFWRDAGLTGQVVSDVGPVAATFDNTPEEGSPGVIMGFIGGDDARTWGLRSVAERRTAVLEQFARIFGPQAGRATDFLEHDWSVDPWTRGCPVGFMGTGVLSAYGPSLRAPVGRIHWAGTETAEVWNGYMDGAVRSGLRAAEETLTA